MAGFLQLNGEGNLGKYSTKKIYLEPVWKLPISAKYYYCFSPDGYEFVLGMTPAAVFLIRQPLCLVLSFFKHFRQSNPTVVAASVLKKWRKPPPGYCPHYAYGGHLVFRPEPWVVSMDTWHVAWWRYQTSCSRPSFPRKVFASPYCKKLCANTKPPVRPSTTVDCAPFLEKVTVLLPRRPAAAFRKTASKGSG